MQKRLATLLLILGLDLVTVSTANGQAVQPTQSADVSGQWVLSATWLGESRVERVAFKVEGDKLTGTAFGGLKVIGSLRERKLEFGLWTPDNKPIATLKGTVENGRLSGTLTFNGQPGGQRNDPLRVRPTRPAFIISSPISFIGSFQVLWNRY